MNPQDASEIATLNRLILRNNQDIYDLENLLCNWVGKMTVNDNTFDVEARQVGGVLLVKVEPISNQNKNIPGFEKGSHNMELLIVGGATRLLKEELLYMCEDGIENYLYEAADAYNALSVNDDVQEHNNMGLSEKASRKEQRRRERKAARRAERRVEERKKRLEKELKTEEDLLIMQKKMEEKANMEENIRKEEKHRKKEIENLQNQQRKIQSQIESIRRDFRVSLMKRASSSVSMNGVKHKTLSMGDAMSKVHQEELLTTLIQQRDEISDIITEMTPDIPIRDIVHVNVPPGKTNMAMIPGPRGVGAIVSKFYVSGLLLEISGVRTGMLCVSINDKDTTNMRFADISKIYHNLKNEKKSMLFRMLDTEEIRQLATSDEKDAIEVIQAVLRGHMGRQRAARRKEVICKRNEIANKLKRRTEREQKKLSKKNAALIRKKKFSENVKANQPKWKKTLLTYDEKKLAMTASSHSAFVASQASFEARMARARAVIAAAGVSTKSRVKNRVKYRMKLQEDLDNGKTTSSKQRQNTIKAVLENNIFLSPRNIKIPIPKAHLHYTLDESDADQLMISSYNGDTTLVQTILSSGNGNVHATDSHGRTALLFAVFRSHLPIMINLMQNGADPCHSDVYGNTPVHAAFYTGDEVCIRYLLSHGGSKSLNTRNKQGFKPKQVELHIKRVNRWMESLPTLPKISNAGIGSPSRKLYEPQEDDSSPGNIGTLPTVITPRNFVTRRNQSFRRIQECTESRETWLGPHTSSTRRVGTPVYRKLNGSNKRTKRNKKALKYDVTGNLSKSQIKKRGGPVSYILSALQNGKWGNDEKQESVERIETPQRKLEELVHSQKMAHSRNKLGPVFRPFTAMRDIDNFGPTDNFTWRKDTHGELIPLLVTEQSNFKEKSKFGGIASTSRYRTETQDYNPPPGMSHTSRGERFEQYKSRISGIEQEEEKQDNGIDYKVKKKKQSGSKGFLGFSVFRPGPQDHSRKKENIDKTINVGDINTNETDTKANARNENTLEDSFYV